MVKFSGIIDELLESVDYKDIQEFSKVSELREFFYQELIYPMQLVGAPKVQPIEDCDVMLVRGQGGKELFYYSYEPPCTEGYSLHFQSKSQDSGWCSIVFADYELFRATYDKVGAIENGHSSGWVLDADLSRN